MPELNDLGDGTFYTSREHLIQEQAIEPFPCRVCPRYEDGFEVVPVLGLTVLGFKSPDQGAATHRIDSRQITKPVISGHSNEADETPDHYDMAVGSERTTAAFRLPSRGGVGEG